MRQLETNTGKTVFPKPVVVQYKFVVVQSKEASFSNSQ